MEDSNAPSIRWVTSSDEIPESLWDACFPPPLEGRWWYRVLERAGLDDQFSFYYAVLERDGSRIGIVPAFVMDVPLDIVAPPLVSRLLGYASNYFPSLRYQRTLFAGSPCADEGTIGLVPGADLGEAVDAIEDALVARAREVRASMIVWKDFPAEAARPLETLIRQRNLFPLVSYPGTRLKLPPGGFESYLATLRSQKRYNLRKKLSRSRQKGPLESSMVQFPPPALIDEIFGLFWQTYEHGKTKFERLTPDFFRMIAQEPVSRFVLLRDPVAGKFVAFMLCFVMGKRVINKFIGHDYSYDGEWNLYFRLWEAAVDWASRSGAEELQSGQTGYGAKLELGHDLVPLTNYCRHVNPAVHGLFKTVASRISWATLDDELKTHLSKAKHIGKNHDDDRKQLHAA